MRDDSLEETPDVGCLEPEPDQADRRDKAYAEAEAQEAKALEAEAAQIREEQDALDAL